ncbi:hypothetical protein KEM55_006174, partial [Ascosphaera atra]
MESLLRLSGLLSETDGGKTDLGVLERRLADKSMAANATRNRTSVTGRNTPIGANGGIATPTTGAANAFSMPGGGNGAATTGLYNSPQPGMAQSNTGSRQGTPRFMSPRFGSNWGSPGQGDERDRERGMYGVDDAAETERKGPQNISEQMCSLITDNCGETRYIGSSSGFSIFSPKGIQWVNEKTGDDSFQQMISSSYVDDNKWIYWKPEIFSDIFARR